MSQKLPALRPVRFRAFHGEGGSTGSPGRFFVMLDNPKPIRTAIHDLIYRAQFGGLPEDEVCKPLNRGRAYSNWAENEIARKLEEIGILSRQREKIEKLMEDAHGALADYFEKQYEQARKRANAEIAKASLRSFIFMRDGRKCRMCGSKARLTIDHILPVIAGGSSEPENLQALCKACNSRKGGKIPNLR